MSYLNLADGGASLMKLLNSISLFLALTVAVFISGPAVASCNGANPPTITAIDPSFGSVLGGTIVTISGTSLGCVSVTFGGVAANAVTASGNTVTATSPAGTVGNVDLTVINPNIGAHANASATTQFSYITTPAAPTGLAATAGDGSVSVSFTAPSNTGGAAVTDYEYQLDGGNWVSAGTTASPIVITGLTNGTSYSIALRAVNAAGAGTASAAVGFNTPSPASELEANEQEIRQVIIDEAVRSLSNTIASNQRMSREARERFIQGQLPDADGVNDVPLDVEGGVDTTNTVISSKGTFFGQTGLGTGKSRLVFGDFDVQHDSETGSSTATLNGKVAWETVVSTKMTLGYFIGGELARSNIMGSFEGDQNRVGLSVGGYAIEKFAENVYLDGFVSLGAGRNNLTMTNGILDLDSDYTTRTATLGATLSAVIEQKGFEIWPELSFSYGRTWLGNVGFTGTAYSMTDNTLSLDAGTVTLANIMFRPEFRVPMDGLSGAESLQLFTFAPRLICEQITTDEVEENCGGGAEVGISAQSAKGLSNVSAKLMADRLGDTTSSSLQLNLEHRF